MWLPLPVVSPPLVTQTTNLMVRTGATIITKQPTLVSAITAVSKF